MKGLPGWVITLVLHWLEGILTPELFAELKQMVVCWFKAKAALTDNDIDDAAVALLAQMLSVDPSKCPVA